ncbi:hypothetical protein PPERSA_03899 [Pseudocohnilembus persalinus]|uniref:Uncharacterized protein n=1 Tax=Pseudocohnilembus persalinus TaxID=266149 RepID=A0A0V0Q949_PSEPJ|nr:hypothetical protein PPERSA_03899 [Pseudocohnilembus persalinus]|eukprot:KRW98764.1 hypothetical protein PPERSA_03899 [Pseudocohnilembus persalinus]
MENQEQVIHSSEGDHEYPIFCPATCDAQCMDTGYVLDLAVILALGILCVFGDRVKVVYHMWPFNYCGKPYKLSSTGKAKYFTYRCKKMVLQCFVLKPIAAIIYIICTPFQDNIYVLGIEFQQEERELFVPEKLSDTSIGAEYKIEVYDNENGETYKFQYVSEKKSNLNEGQPEKYQEVEMSNLNNNKNNKNKKKRPQTDLTQLLIPDNH